MINEIEKLQAKIDYVNSIVASNFKDIEKIQKNNARLREKIEKFQNQINELTKASVTDEDSLIAYYLNLPESMSMELRNERDAFFYNLGLNTFARWSTTSQTVVQFKLTKNAQVTEINKVYDVLVKVIPHIVPDKDNIKRVDFMEHNLSLHASYHLEVRPRTYAIIANRHGRESTVFSSADLKSVLEYISVNLWYGDDDY